MTRADEVLKTLELILGDDADSKSSVRRSIKEFGKKYAAGEAAALTVAKYVKDLLRTNS